MADGSLLGATVDIQRWLRADRTTPYSARVRRDRAIGRTLPPGNDAALLLGWWRRIQDAAHVGTSVGERVALWRRMLTSALAVVGAVIGLAAAGAALAYDGAYPVNLLMLLGLLVGVPLLLLALTLLALPGWVPGVGATRQAFAGLSLGRWAGYALDRVGDVQVFAAFRPQGDAFSRWQLVCFSQVLAVGFFAGALLMIWLLVAFSDPAFGWSTTLEADPRAVHGWATFLASPWRAWLPEAAPDLALVEVSRFTRLEGGAALDAGRLGAWWPFVIMCVAVYGLLPRLLLLGISLVRLRAATVSLLRDDADVTALLDRLRSPNVDFEAQADEAPVQPAADAPAPPTFALTEGAGLVVWNEAIGERELRHWLGSARTGRDIVTAGVLQPDSEWRARLDGLAGVDQLVIFTKGWEPPLLEFNDFIETVRRIVGPAVSLTVVPLSVEALAVAETDRAVWAAALGALADPRLYVAASAEAA